MITRTISLLLAAVMTAVIFFMPVCLHADENKTQTPQNASSAGLVDEDAYSDMAEFLTVLAIVHKHYAEEKKVSWKNLFQAAVRGLMHELDPFSEYESPEEFQSLTRNVSGQSIGIGIIISNRARGIEILSVLPEGPAEKAGIRSGDVILSVNGIQAGRSGNTQSIVEEIRGEEGSSVKLEIYRPAKDSVLEFTVPRTKITVSSVRGPKIIPESGGTAYCRILQFGKDTPADLDKALAKLKKDGMTALILDLRDNPGGIIGSVVPVCSRFLPAGKPVVSVEGRNNQKNIIYADSTGPKYIDLPMVILVNGNSASAAEIFAACMKDYKRAVLVGEHTFGKGSVQTIIPLPSRNNSGTKSAPALKLTTAKYFTPGRHQIHGQGIHPDIEILMSPAQRSRLSMQLTTHPGEIYPLAPSPVRDTALERAMEILKGLRIFQHNVEQDNTKK